MNGNFFNETLLNETLFNEIRIDGPFLSNPDSQEWRHER
jgi:hypothetical protein